MRLLDVTFLLERPTGFRHGEERGVVDLDEVATAREHSVGQRADGHPSRVDGTLVMMKSQGGRDDFILMAWEDFRRVWSADVDDTMGGEASFPRVYRQTEGGRIERVTLDPPGTFEPED